MIRYEVLAPEDMDFVHARSLEILEKIGIRIDSDKVIKMLSDNGCDVDFDTKTVKFKPAIVEKALAQAPSTFKLGGFDPKYTMTMGAGNSYICTDGQGCFTMGLEDGERRESTMADLIDACKIVDGLDYIMCDWPIVTANDVPDGSRTLRELIEMWRVCGKHVQTDCYNETQAKYYLELLDLLFGRERAVSESPLSVVCCPVSPLSFEGPMVEGTIALGEANVPIEILPMPIMGTTSPMSMFSAVIQTNAEILAGITIFEIANPGRRILYGACAAEMDMQTNLCLVSSVGGYLVNIACIQMSKRYGLPSYIGATATDDHIPGPRSGMERVMNAAASYAVGADLIGGVGLTSSAMCLRYDELVYGEDIMGFARQFAEGIRTGEENALTDDLYEVGIGGNFLAEESTVEYLHNGEYYAPKRFKRENYESWKAAGRPDYMKVSGDIARDIIAHHDKDNYGDELYGKLQEILSRADEELAEPNK